MLVCAGASVCVRVRARARARVFVCVCARARVYALRIFSMGKILHFTNTFIIIITVTAPGKNRSVIPTDTN